MLRDIPATVHGVDQGNEQETDARTFFPLLGPIGIDNIRWHGLTYTVTIELTSEPFMVETLGEVLWRGPVPGQLTYRLSPGDEPLADPTYQGCRPWLCCVLCGQSLHDPCRYGATLWVPEEPRGRIGAVLALCRECIGKIDPDAAQALRALWEWHDIVVERRRSVECAHCGHVVQTNYWSEKGPVCPTCIERILRQEGWADGQEPA